MVEDWETSHLGWKCPNQVGNICEWLVCFKAQSGGGVLVLNHDMRSSSRQDSNIIGQDRKCDSFQVGGANVQIQSGGGLVKHQTCLIFCQSTVTSLKTTTDLTDFVKIAPNHKKYLVTDK